MKSKFLASYFFLFCALTMSAQNAPQNWFHMGPDEGYNGVNTTEAYKMLKGKKSRTVVVAVIDSGVDVDHEDLDDVMWVNKDEIPGNNIDDDKNGYVDDIHGWNFIGGKDGKNVGADTYEVTRVYGKLREDYEGADTTKLSKKKMEEYRLFKKAEAEVMAARERAQKGLDNINGQVTYFDGVLTQLDKALTEQNLKLMEVDSLDTGEDAELAQAKSVAQNVLGQIGQEGMTVDELREFMNKQFEGGVEYYSNQVNYAYDPDFNTREIIGDDYSNPKEIGYGNNDYEGPDAFHGTHVSGIIAAERGNGKGMNGVADNVEIMTLRAVPDGDERDKDVANAIRYAVDNGAEIINMSFGKGYSWDKKTVDKALKYAAKNDVLLVHAAGNAAQENFTDNNFPNDQLEKKGLFGKNAQDNWVEVGALNHKDGADFSATFSNYSAQYIDVFAPGVDIYSTVPGSEYGNASGTSMASPVTAGVAALVRSYYPELSAAQIKQILMASVRPIKGKVKKPGTEEMVDFTDLAVAGGTIDAARALELAAKTEGKRKGKTKAWSKKEMKLEMASDGKA